MKSAIESNDGISIKSPFVHTHGYLVVDVEDLHIKKSEYREAHKKVQPSPLSKVSIEGGEVILEDCETIISRGMDRTHLQKFRKNGIDVFITFNTSAQDALKVYLKEHIINEQNFH